MKLPGRTALLNRILVREIMEERRLGMDVHVLQIIECLLVFTKGNKFNLGGLEDGQKFWRFKSDP